jgi:hypothetical protein
MRSYCYRVGDLQREVAEKNTIILSQKEAIREGLLAKEELKKLQIAHVSEVTKLQAEVDVLLDSVQHSGKVEYVFIEEDYHPVLYLPLVFGEQNDYLHLRGEFDEEGVLSMDLTVPISLSVYVAQDKRTKAIKSVVTTDNPYVNLTYISSLKTDIPKPSRLGFGIIGGVGIPLGKEIQPKAFVGIGMSYSLVTFR